MRVRFFNTYDTAAPFFRTLLPHLAARGHRVEAVLARQQYRPGGLGAVDGAFRVRQVPTVALPGAGGGLRKLSIAASYAASATLATLASRWPDANVFLTQPPLFSTWGRALRAVHRRPYCIVGMDLYPWVAMEAGVLPCRGLRSRMAVSLARAALRGAARIVVIGRCMEERVSSFGVPEERIRLIPNWADTGLIHPIPPADNGLRRAHGLADRFVVMYSGNLGVSHHFSDVLEVAHRLRRLPDVLFLFVGSGSRLPEVEGRAAALELPNVRFLDYQPYHRLSESLSMGDVHFVSLRNRFEGLVVPSKTYGVLAAGRPVLYQGSPRGEIARMIGETGAGAVVEQGQPDELEAAVLRAYRDDGWRRRAGERARRAAVERYGVGPAVRAYADLLEELDAAVGPS